MKSGWDQKETERPFYQNKKEQTKQEGKSMSD